MSIQEALRQMRSELGITQTDLAHRLKKSFLTVNRWENGKGFPSRENSKAILSIAKTGNVTKGCFDYLSETLMPNTKRSKSAVSYGFPDIDRDFLFQIADGSSNAIYVIEKGSYNLLYANRKAEQSAARNMRDLGEAENDKALLNQTDKRCFHFFGGLSSPCYFCPLKDLGLGEYTDQILTIPETKRTFLIHAKLAKNKKLQAYIIYLTDLTEKDTEAQALYELTNDIPGGVGIYNVYNDDRIELVFMNETFFQMIGKERKEALLKDGESDLCLIYEKDIERLWAEIKDALALNRHVDISLRMRIIDGKYHWIRINGKLIKQDLEKKTFYCVFDEIEPPEDIKLP